MSNVLDYLDWRDDLRMTVAPFGEVDAMVLSLIAYQPFDGIVFETGTVPFFDAAQRIRERYGGNEKKDSERWLKTISLIAKAAKSKRFGSMQIGYYTTRWEEHAQTQFCALSFLDENGDVYVSFRGTDDSIVGWKENFNMSFLSPVPAQVLAVQYLESIAKKTTGRLWLCGHSKGGNLALYAAVECAPSVQARIVGAYNLDGPGFLGGFSERVAYRTMRSKLYTFVPQESLVGLLLEEAEDYRVVSTDGSGLFGHDGFSWRVLGAHFLSRNKVSAGSLRIDASLTALLGSMTAEEREAFVEALYEAVVSTGAKSLSALSADKWKLLGVWGRLPAQSRAVVYRAIGLLLSTPK